MNRAAALLLVAVLALGLDQGCVGTETGNPPAAPDPMFVEERDDPSTEPDAIRLAGEAGAVDPPEGEVVVLTLDVLRDAVRAPIEEDGSFGPVSTAAPRDGVLRLWVERDGERSSPVDVVRSDDGTLPAAPLVLGGCLEVGGGDERVLEGPRGAIEVHSRCDVAVELEAPRLRASGRGIGVAGDGVTLPSGETAVFELTAEAGSEDVVFLTVRAPETGRLAVTVRRL